MPGSSLESERFTRLIRTIDPGATLLACRALSGGVSAQTTAIDVRRADGRVDRLVVRAHGRRDLARDPEIATHEYQLLRALASAGLPVPVPLHVIQAGEVFDGPAVVLAYVDGEVVTKPESPARFIAEFAAWLARIHEFDLASADLTFLVESHRLGPDRLTPGSGDTPVVRSICEALNHVPLLEPRNPPVLLHGDYWMRNLLWRDGELAAIIDWEDASIGEPLADLARSRLELHWTLGELARERFTSYYQSYRDIDIDDLAAWDLVMALGIARSMSTWGLTPEREREMTRLLEGFVEQATAQLSLDRS